MTDPFLANTPSVRDALVERGGVRALLQVPLLKDGAVLGFIAIFRREPGVFPDKQVALLEGFAAQAVIAMDNARLLTEQREALERQTATAEVLGVINQSPGNLAPVFDAMLDRAMRLCEGAQGTLWMFAGEQMRATATVGYSKELAEQLAGWREIHPFQRRLLQGERVFQIIDLAAEELYRSGNALTKAAVDAAGIRTVVFVALVKDATTLGGFTIGRHEVRGFTDKQIALLENFAAQAVIAMENTRLLTEQREALERQTATAEVLGVINASPGNLVPVFDTILEKALRLCGAAFGGLVTFDGQFFHFGVTRGMSVGLVEALRKRGPVRPSASFAYDQIARGADIVHIPDITDPQHPAPPSSPNIHEDGARTTLFVALRGDNALLGALIIFRKEVRLFSDEEIALVQSFAAQAVIAMENARLLNEQREALEQQTATAEVLQVINASPGDLVPVFDVILEKAHSLCSISHGSLHLFDGEEGRAVAVRGLSDAYAKQARQGYRLLDSPVARELLLGKRFAQIIDAANEDFPLMRSAAELEGIRTALFVPLRKESMLLGMIVSSRREVRSFSDQEVSLLENFAAQAVIAIENARLLTEQREALQRQTATSEVLQVINSSPGNLVPVFHTILEKAHTLCGAVMGSLVLFDGTHCRAAATHGYPEQYAAVVREPQLPTARVQALINGDRFVHVLDVKAAETELNHAVARSRLGDTEIRTALWMPLRSDSGFLGFISGYRCVVRAFSEKEIALLESFAAQAVIAMENARLLDEIRQRQEELRITFENMGDGVAMFDEAQHLAAWNGKFQEIFDLPDDLLGQHLTYEELLHFLAARGDFGTSVDTTDQIHQLIATTGQPYGYERTLPDGRVIDIRRNPVPDGGFVLIFSDITERKRSEEEIRAARDAAEAAYRDLKTAQASLIQAEKMASLGQLTAGIAHEIKNPLNFVNNFASLSVDLLDELKQTAAPGLALLDATRRAEVDELAGTLASNLGKINEHGRRADGIVRSMLEHSRGSSGERRSVDLNALVDEALNLAYHGARAQDQSFNITLERKLDDGIAPITLAPQDMTRVLLNLFSNGFYAARERQRALSGFEPSLKVSTRQLNDAVEITVRDNGIGIPSEIKDRLFQPFFTTKPPGEGTGLGLSMSYDIITQQHGGSISVDSKAGEYTEFTIRLPRTA